jgi:hypothetical protein
MTKEQRFTVRYKDVETGQIHTKENVTELEALRTKESCEIYVNLEWVGSTPQLKTE